METQVLNATEYRNVSLALLNESKTTGGHGPQSTLYRELRQRACNVLP